MFRQSIIRSTAIARTARPFSTSPAARKDTIDTIKESAQAAANKASQLASDAAKTIGIAGNEAKAQAEELGGKAKNLAGEASKEGNIASGKVQGKAHELAGQAKGAAAETKGKIQS